MKPNLIDKKFEALKNYVTNVNNFANADFIEKYLEYINNYGK